MWTLILYFCDDEFSNAIEKIILFSGCTKKGLTIHCLWFLSCCSLKVDLDGCFYLHIFTTNLLCCDEAQANYAVNVFVQLEREGETLASTSQVVILSLSATKLAAAAMAVRVIAILTINLLDFLRNLRCLHIIPICRRGHK